MRVGVIGAGMFGQSTMRRILDAGAELVSVFDVVPERAKSAAETFSIPHHASSLKELLDRDDIDLVYVAVPPDHHHEAVSAVLDAGKNVWTEKPLAKNAEQAQDLADRAAAAGVINAVDHEMRYDPLHRYARRLVAEGFVGQPRVLTMRDFTAYAMDPRYPTYYATWTAFHEPGGGVAAQHLSHTLDLMQITVGGFLTEFSGLAATYMPRRPVLDPTVTPVELFGLGDKAPITGVVDVDGDDVVTVSGVTDNGVVLTAIAGWTVHHPAGLSWELYGDEGTLRLTGDGELWGGGTGGEMTRLTAPSELGIPALPGLLERSGLGVQEAAHMGFMVEQLARDLGREVAGETVDGTYCTLAQAVHTRRVLDQLVRTNVKEGVKR